jgi:hypothetical protein
VRCTSCSGAASPSTLSASSPIERFAAAARNRKRSNWSP